MRFERMPRVPAKSRLSWRIARLSLDDSGKFWSATAVKGDRVSVVRLPQQLETWTEEVWLARVEAAFEQGAHDPCAGDDAAAVGK